MIDIHTAAIEAFKTLDTTRVQNGRREHQINPANLRQQWNVYQQLDDTQKVEWVGNRVPGTVGPARIKHEQARFESAMKGQFG